VLVVTAEPGKARLPGAIFLDAGVQHPRPAAATDVRLLRHQNRLRFVFDDVAVSDVAEAFCEQVKAEQRADTCGHR